MNNKNNTLVSYRNTVDSLFGLDCSSAIRSVNRLGGLLDSLLNSENFKNNEKSYTFEVELPRFKKDEVTVKLEDGILNVVAESKDKRYFYQNRFSVGRNIDTKNITAKLEDGILTVTLPKTEQAVGKVIEVT
jgi:HSP20 family molecular chaperone IbpA